MTIEIDAQAKVTAALEEYRLQFEALVVLDVSKENLQLVQDSFSRLGVLQREHAPRAIGRLFDLMASHVEIMANEPRRPAYGSGGGHCTLEELQRQRDKHREAIKRLRDCLNS